MEKVSKNLAETEQIAKNFLEKLIIWAAKRNENSATVVGLSGDLGSGKTTFTQAIALALGIKDTVQSPTFVIIKNYKTHCQGLPLTNYPWGKLVHIDCYRFEKPEDLIKLGWAELIADSVNLIFIEWPENVAVALPSDLFQIKFETVDETTRKIIYD